MSKYENYEKNYDNSQNSTVYTQYYPQDLGITRKFVDKYIFCGIIYLLLYQNTDKGTSYPQQIAVKINGLGQFYIDI